MTAAIRLSLQKTIFQADGESLVAVAYLKQVNNKKKKKETYVCLVVTLERPIVVRIYLIKNEKDNFLKKKTQFLIRDVKVIDGINPRKPNPDFKMIINDKEYLLSTSTYTEKELFIRQLYKLSNKHNPLQKPDFINLSIPLDVFVPQSTHLDTNDEGSNDLANDYQPMTTEEEADFRELLEKANLEVGKARQFADVLNEQLVRLDSANIESIMGSEQHVNELINLIDSALDETSKIENQLNEYDAILSLVRDSVEVIEEKDSLGQIERTNTRKLMKDLLDFIYLMDSINDNYVNVLINVNLSDPTSINLCSQAARAINLFLTKKTDLKGMSVYQERVELLNKVTAEFIDKLYSHITALFETMEKMIEPQCWGEIIMQKHTQRHRTFLPCSDLIAWLKIARPAIYQTLIDRYKMNADNLYKKEFFQFFQNLTTYINNNKNTTLNNQDEEAAKKFYLNILETVVTELRIIVESEQTFCLRFFNITSEATDQQISGASSISSDDSFSAKNAEKRFNDQLKNLIGPIFESLPAHIQNFIFFCKERNPYIIIDMYVALTTKLKMFQTSTTYFSVIFGSILINVKRLFDEQMKFLENSFINVKIAKKNQIGVLDNISKFKATVISTSAVFSKSDRKNDLDKWHGKFADAVIQGINNAAESVNSKVPSSVVRLKNFYAFRDVLSELKIECLENKRKLVKQLYEENIDIYVRIHVVKLLEKMNIFFDRIKNLIKSGKKPTEIAFEQQFSKAELNKIIAQYSALEVKKGLENLYCQIQKHFSPQSFVSVIWRNIQNEFIKQIKTYQDLINQCYPTPQTNLNFTIDQILEFCSEIA